MKHRIVKWYNGKFAIQKKFLFWWTYIKDFESAGHEIIKFSSLEEARKWFNRPYDDSIVETFET